jgi:hypothetical protein
VRPTQSGDICILLEPVEPQEIFVLHQEQGQLQSVFGGTSMQLVHLTCQRFNIHNAENQTRSETQIQEDLVAALTQKVTTLHPFPIMTLSLVPLYVPFEQTIVLKWCIHITDELRIFIKILYETLQSVGIRSLYKKWFIPTLITTLRDIDEHKTEDLEKWSNRSYLKPLFTASQIELSKIYSLDNYAILATIPLAK